MPTCTARQYDASDVKNTASIQNDRHYPFCFTLTRLQVYKRVNLTRSQEEYQLWGEWDSEPGGDAITDCLQKQKVPLLLRGLEAETRKADKKHWWQ